LDALGDALALALMEQITIIGGDPERFTFLGIPCRADIIPGLGPLGGLHTALKVSETKSAFVLACDMPGLNAGLIRFMADVSKGFEVTVPVLDGRYEPLHAVYAQSCIAHIESRIRKGERRTVSFYDSVSIRAVTEEEIRAFADPETAFRNINYRDDVDDS
jgi:molybdopterin-guanine dinucleotide biosynthesis protein A